MVRWQRAGFKIFVVALNVSPKQLKHESFLEDVNQILASLNELGIDTAIDDFGTGYSSLSLLKTLPFQYMKLDRAFVKEVLSDGGKLEAILKGLIEIANSLKLTMIKEAVETLDQLEVLRKLGAHRIQGYYFSKPVAQEKAIKFLEE